MKMSASHRLQLPSLPFIAYRLVNCYCIVLFFFSSSSIFSICWVCSKRRFSYWAFFNSIFAIFFRSSAKSFSLEFSSYAILLSKLFLSFVVTSTNLAFCSSWNLSLRDL